MVPLSFAGQDFVIVDRAALYWPREKALFVADLHFEKASWYARGGQMLPPYDSAATLDRLERARLERRPGSFVERSFRRRRDDGPVRGGEPGPLDGDEEEEESNGERSDARVELLRPPGGRPRDVGGPAARGDG